VGFVFLASEFEMNLGGCTEDRPALLEINIFDVEFIHPCGELPTHPSGRGRLAGPRRAMNSDRRREIPFVDAIQYRRQLAFLALIPADLHRWAERIERALLGEHAVARFGRGEAVVVLAHGSGFAGLQRNYECVYQSE
jgi:hypothetical protein